MSVEQDIPLIVTLNDSAATLELVGGKGASLARMARAQLPVPRGFFITTRAYQHFITENELQERILAALPATGADIALLEKASEQISSLFLQSPIPESISSTISSAYLELGGSALPVAVRSSATAEDLPELSFAGQQETFLNIQSESKVLDAVKRCWASLWTARAIDYRARQNIAPQDVSLAIVVQELVQADAAGILFTANPLTRRDDEMVINASWGLGEAIVGGQVTPDTIILEKKSGTISSQQISNKGIMTVLTPDGTRETPVPEEKRSVPVLTTEQIQELAELGVSIETLYAQPMDIEWSMQAGHIFIVQARPITTLHKTGTPPTDEEWNDSLAGNYLWTSANLGEAVPDVMTPATWSLIQIFMSEATSPMFSPGIREFHPIGNIGGRFYMNMSLIITMAGIFGVGQKALRATTEEVFGRIPENLDIPLLPTSRWQLLGSLLPIAIRLTRRIRAHQKGLSAFLATAPERCEKLHAQIEQATNPAQLLTLWQTELEPLLREASAMLEAAARQDGNALIRIRGALRKLVGDSDSNALLSGLSGDTGQLASLGLLLGLTRLARGEIDRATFTRRYGHRSPHELEVSLPRPVDDPGWIDRELAQLSEAPVDADTLLARQQALQVAAWQRFQQRYPRKAAGMRRRIAKAAEVFRARERARSEVVRVFWVLRTFILRAGVLTDQHEALFFLSINELQAFLVGNTGVLAHIPARRALYERYRALPTYPTLICGHFDPFQWAADPHRRNDIFTNSTIPQPSSAVITGFPGMEGSVEGRVRVLKTVDEGNQLQPGEILVTIVTNVGWTPLFPRAAAIVTDVGAPLSHAAIVARELGIPAVVGCGNATTQLHTGDLVRVNGQQGTVEILTRASS